MNNEKEEILTEDLTLIIEEKDKMIRIKNWVILSLFAFSILNIFFCSIMFIQIIEFAKNICE